MSSKLTPTDETFQSHDSARFSGTTLFSSRFRESTHLIPSPGSQGSKHKTFEPLIMKLPVVIGTPLLMLGLGIGLEVAIFVSNKNNGFKVPESNVFDVFGDVSGQFLASFFPTLLIMPFAFAWRELDWNLRWYQPYVVLQKGNAVAEESLLLDYISLGPLLSLFRAMQYKHRVIFWSSFTAILTYLFQPLTGSIFQIRQAPQLDTTTVIGTKSVGLAPDVSNLSGFMAAAGYVDASVIHGLGDPPFVQRGWATAEVIFPKNPYLNGTLTVNTFGIQSNVNCSNPSEKPVLTPAGGTSLILSSKSIDGCAHNLTFDPNVATLQYGVDPVPCPGKAASLDVQFQPVMFWYYHIRDYDGTQEVKTVFCTPYIAVAEVQVVANLNDGLLANVKKVGDATQYNNVTSGTQAGEVFNGLIFDNVTNPFIQARAVATRSIVPGAVFRAAQLLPNGSQSAFDLPNGLLDLTSTLYTRHLSVSAQAVYFVGQNTSLPADIVSLVPRLKVDGLPAHLLALLLVMTGIIGVFLHIIHRRARKRLLLAAPPGSIASVVALTARSGFGELLLPYDDEITLEKKLDGLRFRLDRRTGAILADDHVPEVGIGPDEAMLALLGRERAETMDMKHSAVESSSLLAFQAAAQSLPWERSWVPAGMAPVRQQRSDTEYVP
ncbi:hypothetical protein M413DRAFT_443289 [Hebeloma cylindrosporum]|uniref:Uncharacterized protein n=1 Tax=Hebeloma cylindrosporum TaxID=76867 RepID=A0A0C3C5Y1_HEBCY|nr:hypothetical protein M413DRAFT_443289 [Hebeloma cylindrosporum h7]